MYKGHKLRLNVPLAGVNKAGNDEQYKGAERLTWQAGVDVA